jgi:5-methylcytosine-specific restriction enzyme A
MPLAPLRGCVQLGCPALVQPPATRCAAHAAPPPSPRPGPPPVDTRPSAWRRGYDAIWRGWRLAVLQREPLCRSCAARGLVVAAREVDHITPKRDGGTESFDNLQPLCKACHSAKTLREGGSWRPR